VWHNSDALRFHAARGVLRVSSLATSPGPLFIARFADYQPGISASLRVARKKKMGQSISLEMK